MTNFDPQEAERLADQLPGKRPAEIEAATMLRAAVEVVRELRGHGERVDAQWSDRYRRDRAAWEQRLAAAEKVIEAVTREIATMPGFNFDYMDTAKALKEYDGLEYYERLESYRP